MHIAQNGANAEIMIKRSIPITQWSRTKESSKAKDRNSTELNYYINSMRSNVMQIYQKLLTETYIVIVAVIIDRFYCRDKSHRPLLEVYAEHNEKCQALIGKGYSLSTIKRFNTLIRHLKEFITQRYNKKDVALSELTISLSPILVLVKDNHRLL